MSTVSNSVNSVNSYSAVLPPSPMVFFFTPSAEGMESIRGLSVCLSVINFPSPMCFPSRFFFPSAGQISSIPKYWTLEVSVFVGDFEGVSAILFLWVIFCYQARSVTGVGASRNGDKLATLSWNLGSHKPQSPNFPPTPFQLYSDSSSLPKDNSLYSLD